MSPDAPAPFDGCRARLDALLAGHADIDVVEREIDEYALDRESKDALWLWASGQRRADHGRRPALSEGDGHD